MAENDIEAGDMSRCDRLRWRIARTIMPSDAVERRRATEDRIDNRVHEMFFKVGAAAGYKKGREDASGSASDYRVEGELQ